MKLEEREKEREKFLKKQKTRNEKLTQKRDKMLEEKILREKYSKENAFNKFKEVTWKTNEKRKEIEKQRKKRLEEKKKEKEEFVKKQKISNEVNEKLREQRRKLEQEEEILEKQPLDSRKSTFIQTDREYDDDREIPISKKNTFVRSYWSLKNSQSFRTKQLKFIRALEYCQENNLESKAKIRRLRMKINRWNVENERDVEAMIPDYDHLIDLIEEFETKE